MGVHDKPIWLVCGKMVNGKQCTVLLHVDDLISHVDKDVVSSVIAHLEQEFGKEAPLTQTRGHVHELGMMLDFSVKGKAQIQMYDYIDEMLSKLPNDSMMRGTVTSPAASHLFQVSKGATKLDEEAAQEFHHNVAKLLFLCKRARPDIQTAVAFLTTRVKSPDEDDYKKLGRVMRYLRATARLPLTLEADNLHLVKWWVDGAFAVHADMRSHTGGAMSLGKGVIYGALTRQKLNTKSSTEAELIGVNDLMPQILWTRYFLEAQGYPVRESVVLLKESVSALSGNLSGLL